MDRAFYALLLTKGDPVRFLMFNSSKPSPRQGFWGQKSIKIIRFMLISYQNKLKTGQKWSKNDRIARGHKTPQKDPQKGSILTVSRPPPGKWTKFSIQSMFLIRILGHFSGSFGVLEGFWDLSTKKEGKAFHCAQYILFFVSVDAQCNGPRFWQAFLSLERRLLCLFLNKISSKPPQN